MALGNEKDCQHYSELNAKIRAAFADEYVSPDGMLPAHYQGMYVLALKMEMVPAEIRSLLTNQLVDLIVQNGYRLDTGFVSVAYLLDVLCDNGRKDIAYQLLFQTECPSWFYEVEKGATTIWETWDAIKPEGQVNLASFNHYAFGCVGDWMYRFIGGLDKTQAGYKHIVIRPKPHKDLTYARTSHKSVCSEIISSCKILDGMMRIHAVIPTNATATIRLPEANFSSVLEGGTNIQASPDVSTIIHDGNDISLEVGSGSYVFEYPYPTT